VHCFLVGYFPPPGVGFPPQNIDVTLNSVSGTPLIEDSELHVCSGVICQFATVSLNFFFKSVSLLYCIGFAY